VETTEVDLQGIADALLVDTTEVAVVVGIPILVLLVVWVQIHSKKRKTKKHRKR
jgi:hypothetical protein